MFRNDHPEYYWLSNSFSTIQLSSGKLYPVPVVADDFVLGGTRRNIDERMDEAVKWYITQVQNGENTYQKIRLVHDMIINATDYGYDTDGTPLDTPAAHSIVGVFDDDHATNVVCEGYSKSFQLILNALGIETVTDTEKIKQYSTQEPNVKYKVLLVDSLDKMKPLCHAYTNK